MDGDAVPPPAAAAAARYAADWWFAALVCGAAWLTALLHGVEWVVPPEQEAVKAHNVANSAAIAILFSCLGFALREIFGMLMYPTDTTHAAQLALLFGGGGDTMDVPDAEEPLLTERGTAPPPPTAKQHQRAGWAALLVCILSGYLLWSTLQTVFGTKMTVSASSRQWSAGAQCTLVGGGVAVAALGGIHAADVRRAYGDGALRRFSAAMYAAVPAAVPAALFALGAAAGYPVHFHHYITATLLVFAFQPVPAAQRSRARIAFAMQGAWLGVAFQSLATWGIGDVFALPHAAALPASALDLSPDASNYLDLSPDASTHM